MPGRYNAVRREAALAEFKIASFGPLRHRPCPVCDADDAQLVFAEHAAAISNSWVSPDVFSVGVCRRCAMAYSIEVPTEEWFARYHSPEHNPELAAAGHASVDTAARSHQVSRSFYLRGLRVMRRAGVPRGARVLDVGCSEGYFVHMAGKAGFDTIGVDPVPSAVEVGRSRGLHLYVGSAEDAPAEPGSVDVVTMWDTVEHFADPKAVLGAAWKVLKRDGLMLLTTPNFAVDIARLRKSPEFRRAAVYEYWRGSLHCWDHVNLCTTATLDRQLEGCGFTVKRCRRPFLRATNNRARLAALYRYTFWLATRGKVDLTSPQFVVARRTAQPAATISAA